VTPKIFLIFIALRTLTWFCDEVNSGGGEKRLVPGWLQIVGFVIGLVVTVYSAFFAAREKDRADLLARQIANEKEVPRIEQGRFVFAGDALKSVLSGKKDIVVEGLPNPEFAATGLGKQIMDELKSVTALKQLQAISVEFISFTNKGPRIAENLKVLAPDEKEVVLGLLAVNTTKLLPVLFESKQPFKHLPPVPPKSPPTSYTATYTLLGEHHDVTAPILPRATVSWIPVVGNTQGVGRALNDEDMERHLEMPRQP
jgi:hypothetical protein